MAPRRAIVPQPRPFSPQLVSPSTLPPRHVRPNRPRHNSANPPLADGQRPRLRDLAQMTGLVSLVRVVWVSVGGAALVMGGGAVRKSRCSRRAEEISCHGGQWALG